MRPLVLTAFRAQCNVFLIFLIFPLEFAGKLSAWENLSVTSRRRAICSDCVRIVCVSYICEDVYALGYRDTLDRDNSTQRNRVCQKFSEGNFFISASVLLCSLSSPSRWLSRCFLMHLIWMTEKNPWPQIRGYPYWRTAYRFQESLLVITMSREIIHFETAKYNMREGAKSFRKHPAISSPVLVCIIDRYFFAFHRPE